MKKKFTEANTNTLKSSQKLNREAKTTLGPVGVQYVVEDRLQGESSSGPNGGSLHKASALAFKRHSAPSGVAQRNIRRGEA